MVEKKRKYYYENLSVTGVDKTSMYQLDALYTKYTRDYLQFFKEISGMYSRGDEKKSADAAVQAVEKIRSLLSSVLKTGTITAEDSKTLFALVDEIEDRKDSFVRKMETNKSLAEKIDRVEKTVGVSPEDLNVTREISKRAISQARATTKEGTLSFLKRTAPKTVSAAQDLGRGIATGALGPFSPLLTGAKELFSVGRGVASKIQGRRAAKQQSKLRPVFTRGVDRFDTPHAAYTRPPSAGSTEHRMRSRGHPKESSSLMTFFDKGAYKAAWTKELLEVTKGDAGRGKSIGGLGDMLTLFGAGLLPFLGTAGLLALLAAAVGFTTIELGRLIPAIADYQKSKAQQAEAAKALARSYQDINAAIVEGGGLKKYAVAAKKSPGQVLQAQDALRVNAAQQHYAAIPFYNPAKIIGRSLGAITGRNPLTKIKPYGPRMEELQKKLEETQAQKEASGSSKTPQVNVTIPGLDDFKGTLQAFAEQLKLTSPAQEIGPRINNMHDSGDALMQEYARGTLTFGE
jgi:hypothetical protein